MIRIFIPLVAISLAGSAAAQKAGFGAAAIRPAVVAGGDFGDAPDDLHNPDDYPSLAAEAGPFHREVTQEWIGRAWAPDTTVEVDSLQIDGDVESVDALLLHIDAVSIPAPSALRVAITARGPFDHIRYVNVLIDNDRDGDWDGLGPLREHVGVNIPVDLSMLPDNGRSGTRTVTVQTPTFFYSHNRVLGPTWLRVTLTDEPIDAGLGPWTGHGPDAGFARGETEDHWIELKGEPTPDCEMDFTVEDAAGPIPFVPMRRDQGRMIFNVVNKGAAACPELPGHIAAQAGAHPSNKTPPTFVLDQAGPCVATVGHPGQVSLEPVDVWFSIAPDRRAETANWSCKGDFACVAHCPYRLTYMSPVSGLVQTVKWTPYVFVDLKWLLWGSMLGELLPGACGNGVVDEYEQCDDGNVLDGDGCSALCQPDEGRLAVEPRLEVQPARDEADRQAR